MQSREYVFQRSDLVGGHVVLDLVNTVTGRDSEPTDWLEDYDRVLEWAALTDAFDTSALQRLHRISAGDPRAAKHALRPLRELREAAHDVVMAAISAEPAADHAVANLEREWKTAVDATRLTFADGCITVTLDPERSKLDFPRHILALAALELLQALPL